VDTTTITITIMDMAVMQDQKLIQIQKSVLNQTTLQQDQQGDTGPRHILC
jgi:hypothetical protein